MALKPSPEREAKLALAHKLYVDDRQSWDQIARAVGISREVLRRYGQEKGWKEQRADKHGPNNVTNLSIEGKTKGDLAAERAAEAASNRQSLATRDQMEADLAAILKLTTAEKTESYKEKMVNGLMRLPFIVSLMQPLDLLKHAANIDKLDQIACRHLGIGAVQGGNTLIQIGLNTSPKAVSPVESATVLPPETEPTE